MEAEAHRPGHKCQAPSALIGIGPNSSIIQHGTNLHFQLEWDDGQRWMVRVRRNLGESGESGETIEKAMKSEAATFCLLHKAALPVPQAWACSIVYDCECFHGKLYCILAESFVSLE